MGHEERETHDILAQLLQTVLEHMGQEAGSLLVGFHTERASIRSSRVPLTVARIGRVCGTGIGIAWLHVVTETSNSSTRSRI